MTRRSREVGIIKSFVLGAALAAALAMPAQAGDNKLALSAICRRSRRTTCSAAFPTRSNDPAVQPEFDLTYGMFYADIWGSNHSRTSLLGDGIEIDYDAGITPKWRNITFNIGGLYYTYPGADQRASTISS